jgi:hypothetical protein
MGSGTDYDANKSLFADIFASSATHVMKNLPLTQLIFDNFSSSIMTTGKKADTVLPVPKRQVDKPSSTRDYITSKARKISKPKINFFFTFTVTLHNSC